MKKQLLLLLALAGPAAAQRTELSGRAGLSLFQFRGRDADATSHVNYSSFNGYEGGYTNNPYGRRLGTGFALGGRVQHVGRHRELVAFDLGYDWSRSRTAITVVDYFDGHANTPRPADGTTYLRTQNLTAFLGLGRRFNIAAVGLDVLAGPEMAYVFGLREQGRGTYGGGAAWATESERRTSSATDLRLRADLTAWYQRVGVNASYSVGFLNYFAGYVGGRVPEAYSRTLRLGLAYRLR